MKLSLSLLLIVPDEVDVLLVLEGDVADVLDLVLLVPVVVLVPVPVALVPVPPVVVVPVALVPVVPVVPVLCFVSVDCAAQT
jgi:hypothetical protein